MANTGEIGVSGLKQWRGHVDAEFLTALKGAKGRKLFREMADNSAVVGALLLAIRLAIRGVRWDYTSDVDGDERLDFLNENRDNLSTSWNDHIAEALSMLVYGFSIFEIVYRRGEDGRLYWRKFATRSQETIDRWGLDESGGLTGVYQVAPPSYKEVFIPIEKALLYRSETTANNPEGRSMLRNAYMSYFYCKNIQQIEGIGIERDLAGLPVIKLPEGADTTDDSASSESSPVGRAARLVRRIRQDEEAGVVLPAGWELELLSTGGSRQFDTDKIITRYESRILMSVLSQFLMLGMDAIGSYALSADMTDLFNNSVNALADIIAEVHTRFSIPRLMALNGMDADGLSLTHTPVGDIDLEALGKFLASVGNMITWTVQDEVWLRGAAKLPEVEPDEIEAERERKQSMALALASKQPPQGEEGKDNEKDGKSGAVREDNAAEPVSARTLGDLVQLLKERRNG